MMGGNDIEFFCHFPSFPRVFFSCKQPPTLYYQYAIFFCCCIFPFPSPLNQGMNHEELSIRSSEFETENQCKPQLYAVFFYKKIHDNEYPLQNYKGCLRRNKMWAGASTLLFEPSQLISLTFFNIFFIYAPSLIYWSTVHVEEGRRGKLTVKIP